MTNMTSVLTAGAGARPSQLHLPTAKPQIRITHAFKLSAVKSAPVNFRFKKSVLRLQIRERWQAVSASNNTNPSLLTMEIRSKINRARLKGMMLHKALLC